MSESDIFYDPISMKEEYELYTWLSNLEAMLNVDSPDFDNLNTYTAYQCDRKDRLLHMERRMREIFAADVAEFLYDLEGMFGGEF